MSEEYAITLGELRDVIETAIRTYGKDAPYILVGCYEAEGFVDKEFAREVRDEQRVRLFTNLCSG